MEDNELRIIKELMEQLGGEMKPSAEDFEERLGRKKPDMAILEVEGSPEGLGDSEDAMELDEGDFGSPEESLKQRLMKLRRG